MHVAYLTMVLINKKAMFAACECLVWCTHYDVLVWGAARDKLDHKEEVLAGCVSVKYLHLLWAQSGLGSRSFRGRVNSPGRFHL